MKNFSSKIQIILEYFQFSGSKYENVDKPFYCQPIEPFLQNFVAVTQTSLGGHCILI